jgi:hypothetical protein
MNDFKAAESTELASVGADGGMRFARPRVCVKGEFGPDRGLLGPATTPCRRMPALKDGGHSQRAGDLEASTTTRSPATMSRSAWVSLTTAGVPDLGCS